MLRCAAGRRICFSLVGTDHLQARCGSSRRRTPCAGELLGAADRRARLARPQRDATQPSGRGGPVTAPAPARHLRDLVWLYLLADTGLVERERLPAVVAARSEEHTSELQSRPHL